MESASPSPSDPTGPHRSSNLGDIAGLTITTCESLFAEGRRHSTRRVLLSADYIIPCSNPMCEGGGLHVAEIVKPLLVTREPQFSYSVACRGTERFHDGKVRVHRLCMNRFEGSVEVAYRD